MKESKGIALDLFEEGIDSVLPAKVVRMHLKVEGDFLFSKEEKFDLTKLNRVFVIGGGKASFGMAKAVENAIGSVINSGLIVTPRGGKRGTLGRIKALEGSHPIPNLTGVEATKELLELAKSASDGDLVVVLISGGGSSLLTLPVEGIELKELKTLTEDLLASGATIGEINMIRRQLSQIKGGKLARAIHPAEGLVLIISDVVGDDLRAIASGPTVPDESTPSDALDVLEKYGLQKEKHRSIIDFLSGGVENALFKSVSKEEFEGFGITNQIIASNKIALSAMAEKAGELGINTLVLSSMLEGESREVGQVFGQLGRSIYEESCPLHRPALLLSGGETTVKLTESFGVGGPNQEFALAAGLSILGIPNSVVGAIDSDGKDGSTDIAGGLVSGQISTPSDQITSYLQNHDSNQLLRKLNGAIITGQTGTNVNDLRLALVL